MVATIETPKSWVATIGALALPERVERRLQELMDRNNEGLLTATESDELAALVEWSEEVSLLRAEALQLLGQRPA